MRGATGTGTARTPSAAGPGGARAPPAAPGPSSRGRGLGGEEVGLGGWDQKHLRPPATASWRIPRTRALGSPAEGRPPRSPSYKVNTDTLRKPCKTPSLASSETQAPPARRGGCQLGPGTLRNRRVLPRAETASPAGWALQSPGAAGPQSPRALRPVQLSGLEEGPGHSSWLSAAPPALLERWAHLSQPVTKQEGTRASTGRRGGLRP